MHPVPITEKNIPIDLLERGKFQPRQQFDKAALQTLADSIKQTGIIQPLVVRPKGNNGRYEIIAGERRWRAAQLASLETVPCRVGSFDDEQAIKIALIENLERQELNPIELAQSIERFIAEFHYTHEEVAKVLAKSRAEVTNLLRLLKLDERVQMLMVTRDLSESHGKLLASLSLEYQYQYAREAVAKGWSSRMLEKVIKAKQKLNKDNAVQKVVNTDLLRLQRDLADYMGAPVRIVDSSKGKGSLIIEYNSYDELEGIFERCGYKIEA